MPGIIDRIGSDTRKKMKAIIFIILMIFLLTGCTQTQVERNLKICRDRIIPVLINTANTPENHPSFSKTSKTNTINGLMAALLNCDRKWKK